MNVVIGFWREDHLLLLVVLLGYIRPTWLNIDGPRRHLSPKNRRFRLGQRLTKLRIHHKLSSVCSLLVWTLEVAFRIAIPPTGLTGRQYAPYSSFSRRVRHFSNIATKPLVAEHAPLTRYEWGCATIAFVPAGRLPNTRTENTIPAGHMFLAARGHEFSGCSVPFSTYGSSHRD